MAAAKNNQWHQSGIFACCAYRVPRRRLYRLRCASSLLLLLRARPRAGARTLRTTRALARQRSTRASLITLATPHGAAICLRHRGCVGSLNIGGGAGTGGHARIAHVRGASNGALAQRAAVAWRKRRVFARQRIMRRWRGVKRAPLYAYRRGGECCGASQAWRCSIVVAGLLSIAARRSGDMRRQARRHMFAGLCGGACCGK